MRAVSSVVMLLAVVVPLSALALAGRSVESQAAVIEKVDETGARMMTVLSTSQTPAIPVAAVDRIAALSGVDWVVGLGPVEDVQVRGAVGLPTPMRPYRAARAPVSFGPGARPGSALVSAKSASRLGLEGAYGVLDPGNLQITGWFTASGPIASLNAFVLTPSSDDGVMLERVIVAVKDAGWVDAVAANLAAMAGSAGRGDLSVQRSAELLAARAAVGDEVARRDRATILVFLGAAVVLASVVVLAGALLSRRDFGRRRALGATMPQLTILVMLATLWAASIGSALGAILGYLYLATALGRWPDSEYALSVGVLTVIALVVASAVPAVYAATRDPLRVLRTA